MAPNHLPICISKLLVHFEPKVRINVAGRAINLQKKAKMAKKWPNYGFFEPKTANVMAQKKHFHQSQLACGLWSAFEPI